MLPERLKTDFHLAIMCSLGAAAMLGILPFAIYRFMTGKFLAGILDLCIVLAILLSNAYAWRGGDRRRASLFLALINTSGCLASATVLGSPGLYWMYPALLGNYLLLNRWVATSVTVFAMIFLAAQGRAYESKIQLAMFLTSAAVTSVIAFVFAYRTQTQKVELERLATTDPLTGFGNRRMLEQELGNAVESFKRDHRVCSVAMLDLDHFKRINDKYGHETGDEVLVAFANQIRQHIRKVDRCFRFGGEEFVLLMPATDTASLYFLDVNVRQHIAEQLQCHGESVTVSIGAAALRAGESWQDWLARADAAMYQAKHSGRNRTVVDDA